MRELKKLNENKLLFYDIETVPLVNKLKVGTPLFDSWEYKKNKDGDFTQKDIIESYSSEAGLYPEFAKVVSIVVGKIINNKIKLITIDDSDESELLANFNSTLNRNSSDTLVGFVNVGFDTPFVFKRMLINGIQPHDSIDSSGLKPWEVEEVDLATIWKGTSFNRASLINIATAFGLPSPKEDISGADVGRVYWNEKGGLKRISKYCRRDVVTTINIFRKMRLQEPLEVSGEEVTSLEIDGATLLSKLFDGGSYGKKEKNELQELFKTMDDVNRERGFVVLNSLISSAKGKKTRFTKAHLKELKNE